MSSEITKLLKRSCSEEQAREVIEVFGDLENPCISDWIVAGLAKRAHDGVASAAKELRALIADSSTVDHSSGNQNDEWDDYMNELGISST